MLGRQGVTGKADFPKGKVEDLDDEEVQKIDLAKLKEAQQLSRELIWAATRTRVDVAYAVGAMAGRLHKDPERALKIGHQVLDYLNKFPTLGVSYSLCITTELDESQVPQTLDTIEVFADVSYAPRSESYKSGARDCHNPWWSNHPVAHRKTHSHSHIHGGGRVAVLPRGSGDGGWSGSLDV